MISASIVAAVDLDLDLLGSVIVPLASIVISTLIAVSIARAERRDARQERKDAAFASLMLTLTHLDSVAPDRAGRAERNKRLNDFVAAANVAESLFEKNEYPVLALAVAIVLRDSGRGRMRLSYAASAALLLLSEWRQGKVDNAEIEREFRALTEWERGFVAKDWRLLLRRGSTRPPWRQLIPALIAALRTVRRSRG